MEPKMPIEPIAELIETKLTEYSVPELEVDNPNETKSNYIAHGITSPLEILLHKIFTYRSNEMSFGSIEKMIHRIRFKTMRVKRQENGRVWYEDQKLTHISLRWADLIVCALSNPMLFWTDEHLRTAYISDMPEAVA